MSTEESIKALEIYAENFIDSVRKKRGVTLDYSPLSLIVASDVAQDYHEIYKLACERNDPQAEVFFAEATYQLTGYFGEVYRQHLGARWIIQDDPDDALVLVGKTQFPLYRDAIDQVKLGQPALALRLSKIEKASQDLLRDAKPGPSPKSVIPRASVYDPVRLKKAMADDAANAVIDVKAMLKRDLDGTPATLPLLEEAFERLRAMISSVPEQKSAILNASTKKYGAYLGEMMCRECAAIWRTNMEGLPEGLPVLDLGTTFVIPQRIVEAVLTGKVLHMGERRDPVGTVAEFVEFCRRLQNEWVSRLLHGAGSADEESTLRSMSDDPRIAKQVYSYCSMALTTARIKWDLELNFSPGSVEGLEDLLSKLWGISEAAKPGEKPNDTQVGYAVVMYGAYLGETLRRTIGGKWVAIPGPPQRPGLRIGEDTLDPFGRVNVRLHDGPAENAHTYFKKMVENFRIQSPN